MAEPSAAKAAQGAGDRIDLPALLQRIKAARQGIVAELRKVIVG
jgi:hypothetical protein